MSPTPSQFDFATLPGVSDQRMLALVNTYIVHTTKLLNVFALNCDERLQKLHKRFQALEIDLHLLEAKTHSCLESANRAQSIPQGDSYEQLTSTLHRRQEPVVQAPDSSPNSVHDELDSAELDDLNSPQALYSSGYRQRCSPDIASQRSQDEAATERGSDKLD